MNSELRTQNSERKRRAKGFTLIELSIALVIIGLVVGGVLVGQDLIRAAKVRSTVSDIEKFNTAAFTFRSKYNHYPGDIPASNAANLGLFEITGNCGNCPYGDKKESDGE